MPPRIPLPRLTLYTGGKECSLCEVAKVDLSRVRMTHPFDLELWNIRAPPAGADERDVKKWRRLYQYEIPVLHLDGRRIQKHRIDAEALRAVLNEWGAAREAEAAVAEVAVDGSDADRTSAAERKVPSP